MRQNKKMNAIFFGDFQTLWQCRRLLVLIWMLVMWMEWLNLISHINCIFLMGHKMLEIRSDTPFFHREEGQYQIKKHSHVSKSTNSIVYFGISNCLANFHLQKSFKKIVMFNFTGMNFFISRVPKLHLFHFSHTFFVDSKQMM